MSGTYIPPLPVQNFVSKQTVVTAAWLNAVDNVLQGPGVPAAGIYAPDFLSGQIQVTGPTGCLAAYGDFEFGLNVPGPGGVGVSMLLGGATKAFAQIITDEQILGLDGINLFISAGNTHATGNSNAGGTLWLFGGAAALGIGGTVKVQGGTSVLGPGGDVQILGGTSTDGSAGNVYILAGTAGTAGGSVKIYATKINGIPGDITLLLGQPDAPHSVPLWTFSHTGALFPGLTGAGNQGDTLVSAGNNAGPIWGAPGLHGQVQVSLSGSTATVPTAFLQYNTDGKRATIWLDSSMLAQSTGTNDLILSTLPGFLLPLAPRTVICGSVQNANEGNCLGVATVNTNGSVVISLFKSFDPLGQGNITLGASGFTSSGSKGINSGWCITYPLIT